MHELSWPCSRNANRCSLKPLFAPTTPRCTPWWPPCCKRRTEGAVRTLRDPTRGGLATTLNEIAQQSGVGMHLQEATIPVLPQVAGACEMLGLDPLYIANEGKLVAIVAPESLDAVLAAMRAHPLGQHAAPIGLVTEDPHHFVQMTTRFGGRRVVDWLSGEPLPRIC